MFARPLSSTERGPARSGQCLLQPRISSVRRRADRRAEAVLGYAP